MSDKTTIQISKDLRSELEKLGQKGETYEEIIRKLIKSNLLKGAL